MSWESILGFNKIEKKGFYVVRYYCSNCLKHVTRSFPRGTPSDEKTECSNCGCNTAKRCLL
jgi:hypothetical protein